MYMKHVIFLLSSEFIVDIGFYPYESEYYKIKNIYFGSVVSILAKSSNYNMTFMLRLI